MSENQTNTTEEQASVDLSIQDLVALRSVVDIASQRGAFKPTEMVAVGTVYNKLNSFLEAIAKQAQQNQEKSEEPSGE